MSSSTTSTPSSTPLIHRPAQLTLAAARLITSACERKSHQIGVPMDIAIVDSTLHLLQFTRLPGAKLTSIDVAINKAFTAAGHKAPTAVYKENVWPGGKAYGLNASNGGKFMYVAGGVPVVVGGEVVGAVGCSTGTPDQDVEVAQAGVEAFQAAMKNEGSLKAKL